MVDVGSKIARLEEILTGAHEANPKLVYWALMQNNRTVSTNYTVAEFTESLKILLQYLDYATANGGTKFEIRLKTDRKDNGQVYYLNLTDDIEQPQQGASSSIAGVANPAYIGQLMDSKVTLARLEMQMEQMRRDFEHQRKVEELENEIAGLQQDGIGKWERVLEHPTVQKAIPEGFLGMLAARFLGVQAPQPVAVGVRGVKDVKEVPVSNDDEEVDLDELLIKNGFEDVDDTFIRLVGVAVALKQNGIADPLSVLEKITSWAIQNKDTAMLFINNLK